MDQDNPYKLTLTFPGNLEYVSPVRKFIAEMLLVNNYTQKFAYRSEVIVDEVCTNAINYGCKTVDAKVDFLCLIYPEHIEIQVKDQGGNKKDIEKLRLAVSNDEINKRNDAIPNPCRGSLGLEIVRMLSEEVELNIDDNNITTLRVVRKRKSASEIT